MLPMNRPQPPRTATIPHPENAALQQAQAALSQFNADRDYGLSVAGLTGFLNGTPTLNWRNYQLNVSSAAANAQTRAYEQALERWKTSGYVRQGDSAILGIARRNADRRCQLQERSARAAAMEKRLRRLIFQAASVRKINHLCAQGTEVIYDKNENVSNFIKKPDSLFQHRGFAMLLRL